MRILLGFQTDNQLKRDLATMPLNLQLSLLGVTLLLITLELLYTSGYLFPFVKSDIHDLWMVRLYEQDGRTLDLNTMRYTHIALVYCPFCGKKLYDERRSQSI